MPLLEYRCQGCEGQFEWLTGVTMDDPDPICPTCGGKQLARRLSVFATVSPSGSVAASGAAECGGGSCDSGPCGRGSCGSPGGYAS